MGAPGRKAPAFESLSSGPGWEAMGNTRASPGGLAGRLFSDPGHSPCLAGSWEMRQVFGKNGRCFSCSLKRGLCLPMDPSALPLLPVPPTTVTVNSLYLHYHQTSRISRRLGFLEE